MFSSVESRTRAQRIAKEVLSLGLLVIGILAARSTFADHYYVPSGSMEHTLVAGDRVFVDKRAYGLRIPFTDIELLDGGSVQRGDIVIFDSPRDGKRLIKRIVAIGGDEVRLQNGHLSINGEPLASPDEISVELFGDKIVHINLDHGGGPALSGTVDAGMVLAIGDHRGNSVDSRYFGAFAEDEVYGRAIAIYYRRNEGFSWHKL